MADIQSRLSDHETAPLLRHSDTQRPEETNNPSFAERIGILAQEPLTPLTKVLLVLSLILLLTSSVFVGLFAGAQHKLNNGHEEPPTGTATSTTTSFSTVTTTQISATTATTTQVSTTTAMTTSTFISVTTVLPAPGPTEIPKENVCLTPECIILSASILSSLDTNQDPCENFYDFANGGWIRAHPLPAEKGSFGTFDALSVQNKQAIHHILESKESPPSPDDAMILRKLRDYYTSCLNERGLDEIGEVPLLRFIGDVRRLYKDENSGHQAKELLPDLTAALAYLHSKGVDALFSFEIEGDVGDDPNRMIPWFNQPPLSLPSKEYYGEKAIVDVYKSVIESILLIAFNDEDSHLSLKQDNSPVELDEKNFWPPWPWPPWGGDDGDDDDGGKEPIDKKRRAQRLAKQVVKFESRIANASLDLDVLLQDPIATYNPTTIKHLSDTLPQIDFPNYFAAFTPRAYPDKVILTHPPYASLLSSILVDTPSDVVEAYLIVRAALTHSPLLGVNTAAWKAQRILHEKLTGIKQGAMEDRTEYCVKQLEETVGFAVGRYFVNATFGGEARGEGTQIIHNIIRAFKTSLSRIEWMDKESTEAAAQKANAIRVKVGFPLSPNTTDPSSIAFYYQSVHIDNVNFFENALNALKNKQSKKWLQLGRKRDLESWEMYPSIVNAYFNPPANEIVFPAGILQPPFFRSSWPSYVTYGAFGHVASHELTHAFDSAGRLYSPSGKLEQWWSNATSAKYQAKQDCIVKQYSAYTIDDGKGGEVHVNGNLTSGENIGDTGLIQAYRAWKAYASNDDQLLPGLNYTMDQLFFIAFAQIWANSMKPETAIQRVRTDPHSPSRYRVDGTVSNIPEFAKAFKCKAGTKLNPSMEKRCLFWGRGQ